MSQNFYECPLVSGRGMRFYLGLKLSLLRSHLIPVHPMGLPWEAVSLLPHTCRGQFPLTVSVGTTSRSTALTSHVCVCVCDRLSWWVRSGGERGWALLCQPCVYTRWYLSNERTEWTDFKGSSLFPHHPFQLSVQRSESFKGSWGWSAHEVAWNIFEAMQSDFNSFKVWPIENFWAGRGKQYWLISQCPLTWFRAH